MHIEKLALKQVQTLRTPANSCQHVDCMVVGLALKSRGRMAIGRRSVEVSFSAGLGLGISCLANNLASAVRGCETLVPCNSDAPAASDHHEVVEVEWHSCKFREPHIALLLEELALLHSQLSFQQQLLNTASSCSSKEAPCLSRPNLPWQYTWKTTQHTPSSLEISSSPQHHLHQHNTVQTADPHVPVQANHMHARMPYPCCDQ